MTEMTEADRKAFDVFEAQYGPLNSTAKAAWRDALTHARGKQEPVAWMHPHGAIWRVDNCPNDVDSHDGEWKPLYAAPPAESEELARLRTKNEKLKSAMKNMADALIDYAKGRDRDAIWNEAIEAVAQKIESGIGLTNINDHVRALKRQKGGD